MNGIIKKFKSSNGQGVFPITVARAVYMDDNRTVDDHLTDIANHTTGYANVKSFGAKGDGVTDDTVAIQNAINSISATGGLVYFPVGRYIVTNTIIVGGEIVLEGETKYKSVIVQKDNTTAIDRPIVASTYWNSNGNVSNIRLSKLTFESKGERTQYTVALNNVISPVVEDCQFTEVGGPTSLTSKHGLEIARAGGYAGSLFIGKIINCRFGRCICKLNITDSYIRGCEIWGNERYTAVDLTGSSSSMITNNQIVGGATYGAIYVSGNITGLKIVSNYFDGSYYDLDTKWGIYIAGQITRSTITGNNFWHQKSGGIYADGMISTVVSSNNFDECDYYENKLPDIKLGSMDSFANVITNNTHYKDFRVNDARNGTVARTTTSPSAVYDLSNKAGYNPTIISNNSLYWGQYYGNANYRDGKFQVENNSNQHFLMQDYTLVKSNFPVDKDIYLRKSTTLPSLNIDSAIEMYHATIGSWLRLDNLRVYVLSNTGSPVDINTITYDSIMSVSNVNAATNLPTGAGTKSLIITRAISTGYAVQIIFGVSGTGNFNIQFRNLESSVWSAWRKLDNGVA